MLFHSGSQARSAGFSLLELLVVVSIIGILVAISAAAFSTAQQKTRDARRRADIKTMQNGFEQYAAQNDGAYSGTSCSDMASINNTAIFPGGLPEDPKPNSTYVYSCTSADTASYCVCASLETKNGNSPDTTCGSIGVVASSNAYYCLKNLQ